jgi:hypothetical protein
MGLSNVASVFIKVDLPTPFGPCITTTLPVSALNVMGPITLKLPYPAATFSTLNTSFESPVNLITPVKAFWKINLIKLTEIPRETNRKCNGRVDYA